MVMHKIKTLSKDSYGWEWRSKEGSLSGLGYCVKKACKCSSWEVRTWRCLIQLCWESNQSNHGKSFKVVTIGVREGSVGRISKVIGILHCAT